MHTPSQRLRAKIDLMRSSMRAAATSFWTHPNLRDLLPRYLCTLYRVIEASVPLLRLAAHRCGERAAFDPLAATLTDYFTRHAAEERDHDAWLLEDIESLGIRRADVIASVPSATVASLVGSQYYWIQHEHPVALLGYLAVIEQPTDPAYYDEVARRTKLPKDAFRTLIYHARVDSDHEHDLDRCIDALPLTSKHESVIGSSAIISAGGVAAVYRDVAEQSGPPRAAAEQNRVAAMKQRYSRVDPSHV